MISYSKVLTLPKSYFLPKFNADSDDDWINLANYEY